MNANPLSSDASVRPQVSVVFPCLNEATSVGLCIDEAFAAAAEANLSCEVIVVDNGSTDNSASVATKHGACVIQESRRGYGRALRTGIESARGHVIVMADADLTYPLERLGELVEPVTSDRSDMVIGDRLSAMEPGSMPLLHRLVGTPILSFLVRRAVQGLPVSDSQSGFRAFSRDKVLTLGLRSDGMEFASEMLIRAARRGFRVASISTGYRPRAGESKLNTVTDGWRHLRLIALLAPHLLLVWPGVTLALTGAILTALSLVSPAGIEVGSLSWQPVFFSSIALVVGTQIGLAGAVLAHHSSVLADDVRRRYEFVGSPRFSQRCTISGLVAVLAGFLIDGALFFAHVAGSTTPSRSLPLAALAQNLIIGGAPVIVLGVVNGLMSEGSGGASDSHSS